MFDSKNGLAITIKNILLTHFPCAEIDIIFDKEQNEYFISTRDEKLYYSEEYGMLIMEIKLNLLWDNGIFNFFFILDSTPIQVEKLFDSISFSQKEITPDFYWNIGNNNVLSVKDNIESNNLFLAA
jgi:hypothetical protein